MLNAVARRINDAALNYNKSVLNDFRFGRIGQNTADKRFVKNVPLGHEGLPGVFGVGRIAAQTGYGRGMQGARYAGQVMQNNPGITLAVVGGTGALGAGGYYLANRSNPYDEMDAQAQLNPYNQAGAGSGQPLTDEEILEMQMMGML